MCLLWAVKWRQSIMAAIIWLLGHTFSSLYRPNEILVALYHVDPGLIGINSGVCHASARQAGPA